MKGSVLTTRTWVLLLVTALLVAAGALNFAQRLTHKPPLTDGVEWQQTKDGIYARTVAPDAPAGRAGVLGLQPGDHLIAISVDEINFEPVVSSSDVQMYLEEAQRNEGRLVYRVERPSFPVETRYYDIYISDLSPIPNRTTRDYYINFIGILYLLVGLFVLFKQGGRAPFVLHFTTLCLAAFVFHFYKPIGTYEDLDKSIAFLDDAAYIFFAALFLHFCAIYPTRRQLSERKRWLAVLLYVPAICLTLLTALVDYQNEIGYVLHVHIPAISDDVIHKLYTADLAHLVVALIAGATILIRRFFRSKNAVVRQQLKWVVWGSVLAIAPFTLLYAVGYLFGDVNAGVSAADAETKRWLTDAAVLPLVLIPLTFGNSVVRYRLMDVDIVVRRAAVYALTTLAIALMLGAVVYLAGLYALGGEMTPGIITLRVIVSVLGMAAIVMSAAPLKNFLQVRVDRLFYGERYDLRRGLLDFGRTLSATTALEPLL
ncbi:MAG TPA: PDZ domain-containing protein, partial [Pyrinomonadaceae bacterium]|nr:PDZ domain-containing protein [Pyrinomonadaceae bacterium]